MEGLKGLSLGNNAESCVAHARILAPRSRYEEVVGALRTMMEGLRVGDPADPETFIGPMVRADQQQRVRSYIELGIAEGARLVTGGTQTPEGLDGGYKSSGIGREFGATGLAQYIEYKTIAA